MPYYDRETISKVKELDLLSYLQNYEPNELVKINERMFSPEDQHSLKFPNGWWFWW